MENRHKVPKALWNKFGEIGQIAYNNIMWQADMRIMNHPSAKISAEEWETTAHNFATLAAFEVKNLEKEYKLFKDGKE